MKKLGFSLLLLSTPFCRPIDLTRSATMEKAKKDILIKNFFLVSQIAKKFGFNDQTAEKDIQQFLHLLNQRDEQYIKKLRNKNQINSLDHSNSQIEFSKNHKPYGPILEDDTRTHYGIDIMLVPNHNKLGYANDLQLKLNLNMLYDMLDRETSIKGITHEMQPHFEPKVSQQPIFKPIANNIAIDWDMYMGLESKPLRGITISTMGWSEQMNTQDIANLTSQVDYTDVD
jgi:hypothetical protein